MRELFINGNRIELSDDTRIGITFSVNNIGELQDRQSNFTNTFKIPKTKENIKNLEFSSELNSSSSLPYKLNKATYIEDGIEQLVDGIAEITSVDQYFFYINIYSGNFTLIKSIGDITVGELYKNDIAYNWNLINNISSRDSSNYYIYPFIDWRYDKDTFFETTTVDVREMLPCALISQMFNRLSNYTGKVFRGNYLSSDDHLNMILTPNYFSNNNLESEKIIQNNTTLAVTGITTGIRVPKVPYFGTISVYTKKYYPTFSLLNAPLDLKNGYFKPTVNKIGTLNFYGEYQIKWENMDGGKENTETAYVVARIKDDLGVVIVDNVFAEWRKSYKDSPVSQVYTVNIDTPEMTFLSSRSYSVELEAFVPQKTKEMYFILHEYPISVTTGVPIGYVGTPTTSNVFNHVLTFEPSDKIAFDSPIYFESIFRMKVKDVLKDILNLRAIVIQTNNFTNEVYFSTFSEIIKNKSKAKDWSNKMQVGSAVVSFTFGEYAKKNNLKFKKDSNTIANADEQHDYYFTINSETLEDEKTIVELNHPATMHFFKYNNYLVPRIDALKDSLNEWLKPDWRLLQLKKQNTSFNIDYTDGITTISESSNIPICDMVGFENLAPIYYSDIFEMLDQSKVLNAVFNLNATDINELDFTIPIKLFIPEIGVDGYFYLNTIKNYKGGNTQCELIRL